MNKEIMELKDLLKKRYDDEINTTNLFENIEFVLQELDKYKNIVDELEKFLQEDVVYTSNTKADFISGILEANRLALNKLKELKGE